MTVERLIGRGAACMVYPHAAWRLLRAPGRAALVGTYFGAAYILSLALLTTLG